MKEPEKDKYLAEEVFVVQHSGEIPEVTFHESLYYLTEDTEGPGLSLKSDDIIPLKHAVVSRYREIILRDLNPENRDKSIYRGLARCSANWQRLLKFCNRENLEYSKIQTEVSGSLRKFLQQEVIDVQNGNRHSSINCSQTEVEELVVSLRLLTDDLPKGWQDLCSAA